MDRTVQVATSAGAGRNVVLTGFPDRCPRCHSNVVPKPLAQVARSTNAAENVEGSLQCTNSRCGGLFIAFYKQDHLRSAHYQFIAVTPVTPVAPAVGELIKAMSPNFFETYSQAVAAEASALGQLTGIGLRKALEFLVKDFAVAEHPNDTEKILKKPLAACVKDYIGDESTREMAKRAAWLGNDETHYVRRWEDRDVTDLKVLIRLTMNGIENVLLARKYQSEMPEQ